MKNVWQKITENINKEEWRFQKDSIESIRASMVNKKLMDNTPYRFIACFFDYVYNKGILLDAKLPNVSVRLHKDNERRFTSSDEYDVSFRYNYLNMRFKIEVLDAGLFGGSGDKTVSVQSFQVFAVDKKGSIPLLQTNSRPNIPLTFVDDIPFALQEDVFELLHHLEEEVSEAEALLQQKRHDRFQAFTKVR